MSCIGPVIFCCPVFSCIVPIMSCISCIFCKLAHIRVLRLASLLGEVSFLMNLLHFWHSVIGTCWILTPIDRCWWLWQQQHRRERQGCNCPTPKTKFHWNY
jgi:hypothetical protein